LPVPVENVLSFLPVWRRLLMANGHGTGLNKPLKWLFLYKLLEITVVFSFRQVFGHYRVNLRAF
jgi:hypothetical protein